MHIFTKSIDSSKATQPSGCHRAAEADSVAFSSRDIENCWAHLLGFECFKWCTTQLPVQAFSCLWKTEDLCFDRELFSNSKRFTLRIYLVRYILQILKGSCLKMWKIDRNEIMFENMWATSSLSWTGHETKEAEYYWPWQLRRVGFSLAAISKKML